MAIKFVNRLLIILSIFSLAACGGGGVGDEKVTDTTVTMVEVFDCTIGTSTLGGCKI